MSKEITRCKLRKYISMCVQDYFGDDSGDIIFDFSGDLMTAVSLATSDIDKLLETHFQPVVEYAQGIKDDIEARADVKGKFA